jgi:Holliday junction resolvase-like predicted endonuclease
VQKYFESKGYECVFKRLKTPFAEVDLVMSLHHEKILIEVKSLRSELDPITAVSYAQKKRLERAFYFLLNRPSPFKQETWRAHLALVDEKGKVQVIEDFLI